MNGLYGTLHFMVSHSVLWYCTILKFRLFMDSFCKILFRKVPEHIVSHCVAWLCIVSYLIHSYWTTSLNLHCSASPPFDPWCAPIQTPEPLSNRLISLSQLSCFFFFSSPLSLPGLSPHLGCRKVLPIPPDSCTARAAGTSRAGSLGNECTRRSSGPWIPLCTCCCCPIRRETPVSPLTLPHVSH